MMSHVVREILVDRSAVVRNEKTVPDSFKCDGGGAILGLFGSWAPPLTVALPIADRVRAALMRASGPDVPWQISGKENDGRPCQGHRHLHILPFASSATAEPVPRVDRILLWAAGGLEPATLAGLDALAACGARVQFRGCPPLRLEVLAAGSHSALCRGEAAHILGPARSWRSATSFVAPRFTKQRRGGEVDTVREQLMRLVADNHGDPLMGLSPMFSPEHWRAFEQRRLKDPRAPRRSTSGWILHFERPVHGPIALGYGAHFGLGRFEWAEMSNMRIDRTRTTTHGSTSAATTAVG
jgi:CRISPR-associated protein Csb2